jgi:hypothetical protein
MGKLSTQAGIALLRFFMILSSICFVGMIFLEAESNSLPTHPFAPFDGDYLFAYLAAPIFVVTGFLWRIHYTRTTPKKSWVFVMAVVHFILAFPPVSARVTRTMAIVLKPLGKTLDTSRLERKQNCAFEEIQARFAEPVTVLQTRGATLTLQNGDEVLLAAPWIPSTFPGKEQAFQRLAGKTLRFRVSDTTRTDIQKARPIRDSEAGYCGLFTGPISVEPADSSSQKETILAIAPALFEASPRLLDCANHDRVYCERLKEFGKALPWQGCVTVHAPPKFPAVSEEFRTCPDYWRYIVETFRRECAEKGSVTPPSMAYLLTAGEETWILVQSAKNIPNCKQ